MTLALKRLKLADEESEARLGLRARHGLQGVREEGKNEKRQQRKETSG